jgi:hypothetical protein
MAQQAMPRWLPAAAVVVLAFFFAAVAVLGILRRTVSMLVLVPTEILCWFLVGYLAIFGSRLWRGQRK